MSRGKPGGADAGRAPGRTEPRVDKSERAAGGAGDRTDDSGARRILDKTRLVDAGVLRRFRESRPERQQVKAKLRQGKPPAEIDAPQRVRQRMAHLGTTRAEAPQVVDEAVAACARGEAPAAPPPQLLGIERIIGGNNLQSVGWLARAAARARSVGCVRFGSRRVGTGFLVSPTLLLTNNHVIASAEEASRCSVEFDYEDDAAGGLKQSHVFDFEPQTFFVTSPSNELDYALIAVAQRSAAGKALSEYGHIQLQPATGKVLRGEALNIIQHPDGRPKEMALRENILTAVLRDFLHYETDTEPGSSGSPVFNDEWEVVCLHHRGVPRTDERGNPLDKRGAIWDRVNPDDIDWVGNEGVRISRIVTDVSVRRPGEADRGALSGFPAPADNPPERDEALPDGPAGAQIPDGLGFRRVSGDAPGDRTTTEHGGTRGPGHTRTPGAPGGDRDRSQRATSTTTGSGSGMTATTTGFGAQASWTIPLQLNIQIGQPQVSIGAAAAGGRASPGGPTGGVATNRGGDDDDSDNSDVAEALRTLERFGTRIYYDRARDAQEREAYYDDIDPGDPDLADALTELLTGTHRTQLTYNTARVKHLYAWVDLQRDKMVRSIYSEKEYDPASFIREDFDIERRHEARLRERRTLEADVSDESLARFLAELEAAEPFNCEHVVPQSWFGKAFPMQGDLHHLYSCESNCNSFRGNNPYADHGRFDPRDERVRAECGDLTDGAFEPFRGKGKVARATLYFLLRYPGRYNQTGDAYTPQQIETLVRWHEDVPVTEHELHRNQAIFEIQGNRNPFIDHPQWARRVFGA